LDIINPSGTFFSERGETALHHGDLSDCYVLINEGIICTKSIWYIRGEYAMSEKVVTDTTNFSMIERGDRISVNDRLYTVIGNATETKFGVEDPKFWVKRVIEEQTRERKIIKLAFFETFESNLCGVNIRCFRSPEKEAKILSLVKNHACFMQGESFLDLKGNNIRVLDYIRGKNLLSYIDSFKMAYDQYLQNELPGIIRKLINAFHAIEFLHDNGFRHGDIRLDHIIVRNENCDFVWIDFDYDFEATEYPFSLDIFGIGTILAYVIGKGFHTAYMLKNDLAIYGDLIDRIDETDFSLLEKGLFVNLKKLYPDVPELLNNILLRFSGKTEIYYESVGEIIDDLKLYLQSSYIRQTDGEITHNYLSPP